MQGLQGSPPARSFAVWQVSDASGTAAGHSDAEPEAGDLEEAVGRIVFALRLAVMDATAATPTARQLAELSGQLAHAERVAAVAELRRRVGVLELFGERLRDERSYKIVLERHAAACHEIEPLARREATLVGGRIPAKLRTILERREDSFGAKTYYEELVDAPLRRYSSRLAVLSRFGGAGSKALILPPQSGDS